MGKSEKPVAERATSNSRYWILDPGSWMTDAGCPEKPEIFDFIVFRGSAIPGTGNRDRMKQE
jgi:hypothetical protein